MPPLLNEQGDTKRIFNQLHLMTDGRVGKTQLILGIANELMPGRRFKTLERFERRELLKIDLAMHGAIVWRLTPVATGKFYCRVWGCFQLAAGYVNTL
jgi:hypothetical protein